MYEARKVCNLLLAHREAHSFELTNLRLNKLLYFIHGWSLTRYREGLIRNHFLAWKHGPIIRPVYDSFKAYGYGAIAAPATYLDFLSGQTQAVPYSDIAATDVEVIMRVFASYDRYTTHDLVEMSHEPGGPWDLTYSAWARDNRLSLRIPNELIRDRFMREAGGAVRH